MEQSTKLLDFNDKTSTTRARAEDLLARSWDECDTGRFGIIRWSHMIDNSPHCISYKLLGELLDDLNILAELGEALGAETIELEGLDGNANASVFAAKSLTVASRCNERIRKILDKWAERAGEDRGTGDPELRGETLTRWAKELGQMA